MDYTVDCSIPNIHGPSSSGRTTAPEQNPHPHHNYNYGTHTSQHANTVRSDVKINHKKAPNSPALVSVSVASVDTLSGAEESPLLPNPRFSRNKQGNVGPRPVPEDSYEDPRWWRVLPAIILLYVNQTMTIPVIPGMAVDFFGKDAIGVTAAFTSAPSIIGFLFSPLVGALTDKWGRKWAVVVISMLIIAPLVTFLFTRNMWPYMWLQLPTGFFNALMGIIYAFISDCLPPEKRARAFGLLSSGTSAAILVGPLFGSFLFGRLGADTFWLVNNMIGIVTVCYMLVCVHEPQRRYAVVGRSKKRLRDSLNPFAALRPILVDRVVGCLALVVLCHAIMSGYVSTISIYTTQTLGFSQLDVSIQYAISGGCMTVAGFLLPHLIGWVGERGTIFVAMCGQTAVTLCIGLATTKALVFGALTGQLVAGCMWPAISSAASKRAGPTKQGAVQGATAGVRCVADVLSPLLFGQLVTFFQSHFSHHGGYAYICGLLFLFPGVIAVYFLPEGITVEEVPDSDEGVEGGRKRNVGDREEIYG